MTFRPIICLLLIAVFGVNLVEADLPKLNERLRERRIKANNHLDVETKRVFAEGIDAVRNSEVMKTALKPNADAPDFTLMDFRGGKVTLSELYKDGPVVLIFYRGGWCPYCNIQLATMQESIAEFEKLGVSVVAISPDKPIHVSETANDIRLDFHVVSDAGNAVAKSYGLVYTLPEAVNEVLVERGLDLGERNGTTDLPLSASYIINREGKVVYAFLDADYTRRAEPRELASIAEMWVDEGKKGRKR